MTDNKSSEGKKTISAGTVIFIADVSDALKVLKAVQGEARKSTTALKELEEQQKKYMSSPRQLPVKPRRNI